MTETVYKKLAFKVRKLVGLDKLKEAFEALTLLSDDIPELRDEIIQHQGNYNSISKQSQIGLLQKEDQEILYSRVRNSLVIMANKLEKNEYTIEEVNNTQITKNEDFELLEAIIYELEKIITSQLRNRFNLLANSTLLNGIKIIENSIGISQLHESPIKHALLNLYQTSQYYNVRFEETLSETKSIHEKLESDDFIDNAKTVFDFASSFFDAVQGSNEGFLNRNSQNLIMGAENYILYCISEISKAIAFSIMGNHEKKINSVFRDIKIASEMAERLDLGDWIPILSRAFHMKLIPQSVLRMSEEKYKYLFDFETDWLDKNVLNEANIIGRTISSQSIERATNIFFTWRALHNLIKDSNSINQLFTLIEKYGVNHSIPFYLPSK